MKTNSNLLSNILVLICALLGAVFFIFVANEKIGRFVHPYVFLFLKPLPAFSCSLSIILRGPYRDSVSRYYLFLTFAFFFAGLGDILLEINDSLHGSSTSSFWFLGGGSFFWIAQALFAISFYLRADKSLISIKNYGFAIFTFVFCLSIMLPYIHDIVYLVEVIAYELAINSVALFTFAKPSQEFLSPSKKMQNKKPLKQINKSRVPSNGINTNYQRRIALYIAPLGSLLFLLSDVLVLTPKIVSFLLPIGYSIVMMSTYYGALLCLYCGGTISTSSHKK